MEVLHEVSNQTLARRMFKMFCTEKTESKTSQLKAEVLLSEPSSSDSGADNELKIDRAICSYLNLSERFRLKERKFSRQYAQIYAARLMAMKKKLAAAARRKWGSLPLKKLSALVTGERCLIFGTLFKKMEMKPCILNEISKEHNLLPQPVRAKYVDDEDTLVLEDETERVALTGNIPVGATVTGTLIALCGHTTEEGKFDVEEYCFSGLPYQAAPELDKCLIEGEDRFICLASGLGFGSEHQDVLSLQMFADLITGELGSIQDQETCSKIVRIVLAGNALSQCTQTKESETKAKYLTRNTEASSLEAVKSLDEFLVQLASCVPVDVMPGEYDPANHTLPQQPLHRCMFPEAVAYPTMQSVTNPYEALVGGVRILGTSGQNVNDVYKMSAFEERLEILEHNLEWCHIAPTAPDTLGCYPYYDEDPFILEKCPQVYFVGNQPEYKSKLATGENGQKVLLITVPDFSSTKTCVMVNLRTMTCHPLSFSSTLSASCNGSSENKQEQMEM